MGCRKAYRAKAIFPFQKVSEAEMSVRAAETLIIITTHSPASAVTQHAKESPMSKWGSIDEFSDQKTTSSASDALKKSQDLVLTDKSVVELESEPGGTEFAEQVAFFWDFLEKYGAAWFIGLKVLTTCFPKPLSNLQVRLYGKVGDNSLKVKVKLRDLGLVPANYVEAADVFAIASKLE